MAHYFNKSELALPGFSDVFHEFSKIDRQHANRVLELTALHGFRFKAYSIDTSNIVKEAISNYKRNAGKFPLCKETKFNDEEKDDLFLFIRNKHKNKTVLPRAFSILKLTQMIENCYMTINLNQWKDPHLKYVIQREFSTEKLYRRKYISDLMQKLKKETL